MSPQDYYYSRFARLARLVDLHPWILYCDFVCVILQIGGGGIERHAVGYATDLKISEPQKIYNASIKNYAEFVSMFPKQPGLTANQREWAHRLGRCRITLDCLTLQRMLEGIILIHANLVRRYGTELHLLSKTLKTTDPSQLFLRCERLQMQIDDWLYDYLIINPKTRNLRYLKPESPQLFGEFFESQLEILSYVHHFPEIEVLS